MWYIEKFNEIPENGKKIYLPFVGELPNEELVMFEKDNEKYIIEDDDTAYLYKTSDGELYLDKYEEIEDEEVLKLLRDAYEKPIDYIFKKSDLYYDDFTETHGYKVFSKKGVRENIKKVSGIGSLIANTKSLGFFENNTTFGSLFLNCKNSEEYNLSDWDLSKCESFQCVFANNLSLKKITGAENLDISNIENFFNAFYTNSDNEINLDISKWNFANAKNMSYMFGASNFRFNETNTLELTLPKAEDISYIFQKFKGNTLNINNLTAPRLNTIAGLVASSSAITNVSILNLECPELEDLRYMFINCENLEYVDLSNWNTPSIKDLRYMFYGCKNLKGVDLSALDMYNVKTISHIFPNCKSLTGIIDMSDWDMSNLENNRYMFAGGTNSGFRIILPKNLPRLSCLSLEHTLCLNEELVIPKTVSFISCSTVFYDFGVKDIFKRFIVEEGNKYFTTDEYGILYDINKTRIVAIPKAVEINSDTFVLPNTITQLDCCSFSRVNTFSRILLPDCYEITLCEDYVNDNKNYYYYDDYNGIQNVDGDDIRTFCDLKGNSLAVALYIYTTVSEYMVNDTNPRYISYEGCIYSKDGTTLIAVPTRYSGELHIKEGCTTIPKQAFWEGCGWRSTTNIRPPHCNGWEYTVDGDNTDGRHITTIYIPASVSSIEENQLKILNCMTEGWNNSGDSGAIDGRHKITIVIDENNEYFEIVDGKISQR